MMQNAKADEAKKSEQMHKVTGPIELHLSSVGFLTFRTVFYSNQFFFHMCEEVGRNIRGELVKNLWKGGPYEFS